MAPQNEDGNIFNRAFHKLKELLRGASPAAPPPTSYTPRPPSRSYKSRPPSRPQKSRPSSRSHASRPHESRPSSRSHESRPHESQPSSRSHESRPHESRPSSRSHESRLHESRPSSRSHESRPSSRSRNQEFSRQPSIRGRPFAPTRQPQQRPIPEEPEDQILVAVRELRDLIESCDNSCYLQSDHIRYKIAKTAITSIIREEKSSRFTLLQLQTLLQDYARTPNDSRLGPLLEDILERIGAIRFLISKSKDHTWGFGTWDNKEYTVLFPSLLKDNIVVLQGIYVAKIVTT